MTVRRTPIKTELGFLKAGCTTVAGIDEVGRGAWAGPLAVGIAMATRRSLSALPAGVRDSKQLTAKAREALYEPIIGALDAYAIGYATPRECDDLGMTAAQRLATERALRQLPTRPDAIIMDGIYNFTDRDDVLTLVKADQHSRVVAAASVVAKVTRDRLMVDYAKDFSAFGFERNKGYASHEHRRAVLRFGMTSLHRQSWTFASPTYGIVEEAGESLDLVDVGR